MKAGAPSESSTVISIRFDAERGFETARAVGATRVEWTYNSSAVFVQKARSLGMRVGGTINANVQTPAGRGNAKGFDGTDIVAPWMKSWNAKWVTTRSRDTVAALRRDASRYLLNGFDSIQIDDPSFEAATVPWGGDFSARTRAEFTRYLRATPASGRPESLRAVASSWDYREYLRRTYQFQDQAGYLAKLRDIPETALWQEFLTESVLQFHVGFRTWLRRTFAGAPPAITMNLWHLSETTPTMLRLGTQADYLVAETKVTTRADAELNAAIARSMGLPYLPSLIPADVAQTRATIATYFAMGATPLVPWDVFVAGGERLFPPPETYADLFRDARDQRAALDGWVPRASTAVAVSIDSLKDKTFRELTQALSRWQIPYLVILLHPQSAEPIYPLGDLSDLSTIWLKQGGAARIRPAWLAQAVQPRLRSWVEFSDPELQSLSPLLAPIAGYSVRIGDSPDGSTQLHIASESATDRPVEIGLKATALCPADQKAASPPSDAAPSMERTAAADRLNIVLPPSPKQLLHTTAIICTTADDSARAIE